MEVMACQVGINDFLEVKPFHFFHNPKQLHLDPVHAILRWLRLSRIREGYLFRRISVDDRISPENKPLVWHRSKRLHFIANILLVTGTGNVL
jgi:hypothetical protein